MKLKSISFLVSRVKSFYCLPQAYLANAPSEIFARVLNTPLFTFNLTLWKNFNISGKCHLQNSLIVGKGLTFSSFNIRSVFRTQSNIYDEAFLEKQFTVKSHFITRYSHYFITPSTPIIPITLGTHPPSALPPKKILSFFG